MVRGNVPFMIFVAGLVWLFALNGRITLIENLALLLLVPAYTAFVVHYARRIPSGDHEPGSLPTPPQKNTVAIPVLVACLGGCAVFLYFGAQLLLTGALDLARLTGMDELAVGLAVAGPGLSLPVLVASFRTGRRGERNLVAGNVVSGNVFILLCVLSLTGFAASGALAATAALVFLAQIGSVSNQAGMGIEMRAIAAAVIGGVALSGGVGTILGASVGALFITAATSSLSFLGIPGFWADTVIGAILLIALFADARVRAGLERRRLSARYARLDDGPPTAAPTVPAEPVSNSGGAA